MRDFSSVFAALFQIVPALAHASRTHEAYLVGGAVRDMLLGTSPIDYDIVVPEDPQVLAAAISRETGALFFKLGKDAQAVFRARIKDHSLDLVRMAGGTIESDLNHRDFTINAMAVHLQCLTFLDPMQGQNDLENRTIRMVSDQAFLSDPLRMLRAYRFAATLNFEIENETESAIKTHSRSIRQPAGERIREELIRLLATPNAAGYLKKMSGTGLLFDLFPELMDEKGCTQNSHHCFDVLDHTLSACMNLDLLLNGNEMQPESALRIAIEGIESRLKPILKLAMLLHDIGKPRTRTVDAAGTVHFWGHEKIGAGFAKAIAERLKFSNPDSDYLQVLIQHHLRPVLLYQAHQNQSLTRRGIIRFFRTLDTRSPDLLVMALADATAKTEKASDVEPSFPGFISDLLKTYFHEYKPQKNAAALITGRDLITRFGLQPSPVFKIILDAVEEARLSQTLVDREDAFAWVRTWLISNGKENPFHLLFRNCKKD